MNNSKKMSEFTVKDVLYEIKDDIKELKTNNKLDHDKLEKHAIKTNGRITKIETFKNKVLGGFVVLSLIVGGLVLPVVIEMAKDIIKIAIAK